MNPIRGSWGWQLLVSALIVGGVATSGNCALGQVVGDTTLGAESSQVTSPTPGGFQIDGGATRKTNLFHSFSEFSIPTNGSAFFNNALTIENIISRVTGASGSNINGAIRTNGTANLFLINPNGIVFGPNASLNIGGSFVASTARGVVFDNGFEFSATNPQAPPLLTVSVPLGLQYGSNAGSLQAQRSLLRVRDGKTLALVGVNVQLDGARLFALGGRVELAGVGGTGTVGLSGNGNNLSLSLTDAVPRSDVSLTNGSIVRVLAGGGGSIAVNAQNLNITGRSGLLAGIASGSGSIDAQAGDIEINVIEKINLANFSFIANNVADGGVGKGGNLNITTNSLSLNISQLQTLTEGQGNAGSINITAHDSVLLEGAGSAAFSRVEEGAEGKGGNINITTGSLSVTNGAQLSASTFSVGDAGSINITARDSVSFDGKSSNGLISAAFSTVRKTAEGNGGSINITTDSLSVTNGARLQASTIGRGDAGSINITARDSVSLDGKESTVFSRVDENAEGKGGSVNITTGSLSVTNGAQLSASTYGRGDAGSVNITARDYVSFDGTNRIGYPSAAFSTVEQTGEGRGGSVNITTGSLSVTNGAQLLASTLGRGDAGSVNITARDYVSFDGVSRDGLASGAASTVEAGAVGQGGGINITTGSLSVTNSAALTSSSNGQGDAGDIKITARELLLNNQGNIIAQTFSGNGGDIILNVQDLLLMRHNSLISTSAGTAQQGGDGGNMKINAQFIVAVPNEDSDIRANAFKGRGGNINITTQGIYGLKHRPRWTPLSDITASSDYGVNGTVQINTPDVDPSRGLTNLPTELVDASNQIAQICPTGEKANQNQFIITGRGGLPDAPDQMLYTDVVWTDLRLPSQTSATRSSTQPAKQPPNSQAVLLVEATGWVMNDKGEVVLTASAPNITPQHPALTPPTCPRESVK